MMVYLAGLFDANRILVAAHRPAPVQVSFHNGCTTGLEQMDYWLTDALIHPTEGSRERFTETLYRLPIFYNYPPISGAPDIGPLPADDNGFITFGSFNNLCKITPDVIRLWSSILRALPTARLQLKYRDQLGNPVLQKQILARFKRHGIRKNRIDLISALEDFNTHLARYNTIDIALDPFPFTGATTTFQALWMGVPVVTLLGDRFIGRMAGDILFHAGLHACLAESSDDYQQQALDLADDLEQLRTRRVELRAGLAASALCDGAGYAKGIERAYLDMWGRCVVA
ncbi:MAG: hypothetical protein HQL53_03915 [Magnetococcales bacterium]|nr:hypothetical protein [Magnetococcales bacterium]